MRKTKKVVYYPTMMYYPVKMTKKEVRKMILTTNTPEILNLKI